jgi:hypothetical protein
MKVMSCWLTWGRVTLSLRPCYLAQVAGHRLLGQPEDLHIDPAEKCLEILHTLVNDLLQLDALAPEDLRLVQRRLHHGLGDPEHRVAAAGPRQTHHLAQVEGEALTDGAEVAEHQPLDVRVAQFDRLAQLLQPLLRHVLVQEVLQLRARHAEHEQL